jgi:hypothetical protein
MQERGGDLVAARGGGGAVGAGREGGRGLAPGAPRPPLGDKRAESVRPNQLSRVSASESAHPGRSESGGVRKRLWGRGKPRARTSNRARARTAHASHAQASPVHRNRRPARMTRAHPNRRDNPRHSSATRVPPSPSNRVYPSPIGRGFAPRPRAQPRADQPVAARGNRPAAAAGFGGMGADGGRASGLRVR